jgi:hypothetical protein
MKLFQKMLVAGAALSLIAPLGAQATDINTDSMNSYDRGNSSSRQQFNSKTFANELAITNSRIDGLEVQVNEFDAGSFSDTTVMDGKAIFDIGFMDFSETDGSAEAAMFAYSYRLNLNSSFTGDDNLYVRILAGNHQGWMKNSNDGGYLTSVGKGNNLQIDKIWYSFPVGENNTVWVGPKIENYYMHGAAPSIYKPVTKQFTLGGNGNAYGASTDTGAGWAYKGDNGFSISSNVGTKSHTTNGETGLLTDESKTSWATQVGYTQPRYSVSAIINMKYNGWTDGYLHTASADDALVSGGNHTAVGLRGWWRPEETGTVTPSVSVGYDTTSYDGVTSGTDSSDMWFVGMQWQDMFSADDKIGFALAQPTKHDDETTDPFAYELYYSYQANDSITVTPTVFGGTDRDGGTEDVFGALVQTTFKF